MGSKSQHHDTAFPPIPASSPINYCTFRQTSKYIPLNIFTIPLFPHPSPSKSQYHVSVTAPWYELHFHLPYIILRHSTIYVSYCTFRKIPPNIFHYSETIFFAETPYPQNKQKTLSEPTFKYGCRNQCVLWPRNCCSNRHQHREFISILNNNNRYSSCFEDGGSLLWSGSLWTASTRNWFIEWRQLSAIITLFVMYVADPMWRMCYKTRQHTHCVTEYTNRHCRVLMVVSLHAPI